MIEIGQVPKNAFRFCLTHAIQSDYDTLVISGNQIFNYTSLAFSPFQRNSVNQYGKFEKIVNLVFRLRVNRINFSPIMHYQY